MTEELKECHSTTHALFPRSAQATWPPWGPELLSPSPPTPSLCLGRLQLAWPQRRSTLHHLVPRTQIAQWSRHHWQGSQPEAWVPLHLSPPPSLASPSVPLPSAPRSRSPDPITCHVFIILSGSKPAAPATRGLII